MVSAVESVCRVPSFTEFSFRYCGYFSSFFLFERFLRILLGWTLKYALISFRLLPNFLRLPMTNGVGCRVRLSSTEFYRVFFLVLWVFFFSWKTAATAFARAEPIDRSARPVLSVRACVCPSLGIVASTLFDRTQSCGRCTFHVSLSLSLSLCLTVSLFLLSKNDENRRPQAQWPPSPFGVSKTSSLIGPSNRKRRPTVSVHSRNFFFSGGFSRKKKTEAVDHFSLPFTRPILRFEEQWQRCRIV